MKLTEQQIRVKADAVFTDTESGEITGAVWADFFNVDIPDSLVAKDSTEHIYKCLIGNFRYDLSILNSDISIFQLTALACDIEHNLTATTGLIILVYDEENTLRDESFYYYRETDENNISLVFYRVPDYGRFYKIIMQAV